MDCPRVSRSPRAAALLCNPYLVVELPELPLELPEPMLPEPVVLLPEPEPEDGAGVVPGEVVELPEVPPLAAPEPDLLKCASHSERETCPSLLVSTDEKFGVEVLEALAPPDRPPLEPDAAEPDAPELLPEAPELVPLLPDADGVDEDGEDDLSLLVLDEELCATATLDSANSAAAVAALNTFSLSM